MFKGMSIKVLKFYYQENIDSDEYPTFIHWIIAMREQGEF